MATKEVDHGADWTQSNSFLKGNGKPVGNEISTITEHGLKKQSSEISDQSAIAISPYSNSDDDSRADDGKGPGLYQSFMNIFNSYNSSISPSNDTNYTWTSPSIQSIKNQAQSKQVQSATTTDIYGHVMCKDFSDCPYSRRIKDVLTKYHQLMCGEANMAETLDTIFIDGKYTVAYLLDDFHHILNAHFVNDDPVQFESCYEFMMTADVGNSTIACNVSQCETMEKYYKRRNGISDVYQDYRMPILGRIHCYILHTLDISKLRISEIAEIENHPKTMEMLRAKRQSIDWLQRLEMKDKFVTVVEQKIDLPEEDEMKYMEISDNAPKCEVEYAQMEDEELMNEFCRITKCTQWVGAAILNDCKWDFNAALQTVYSVAADASSFQSYVPKRSEEDEVKREVVHSEGVECWYWSQELKPKGAVVVKQKHKDLKDEMLSLPDNALNKFAWYSLYRHCEWLLRTEMVRKLQANGSGADIYGIRRGAMLTLNHLVALKIYTDFTDLNKMFCEHFRLKRLIGDIFETPRSLAIRNRKFRNLAKLLTEAVQCFGDFYISRENSCFRGVDKPFIFQSFISRYNTPLSTSKSVRFHSFCIESLAIKLVLSHTVSNCIGIFRWSWHRFDDHPPRRPSPWFRCKLVVGLH